MNYPKITIVTPCYNMVSYLEETICSVLDQNYPNLEYIIIDGGSTDGSVEIIKKYESKLSYWISEKDQGMYHAIQKGFDRSTGEIMGWLNADDFLHKKSLFVIASILSEKKCNWIQGCNTIANLNSSIVSTSFPDFHTAYYYYTKSFANSNGIKSFSTIQQESTFWTAELWKKSGSHLDLSYRFAGDFELWMRFFRYEELYFTKALIGAFRIRPDQLSQINRNAYLTEMNSIVDREIKLLSNKRKNTIRLLKILQKIKLLIHFPGIKRFYKSRMSVNEIKAL